MNGARHPAVLAVTGLAFEARIAARAGAVTCCGDRASLERTLSKAAEAGYAGLLSFGLAGGLDPALRPGDLIAAQSVLCDGAIYATDLEWLEGLLRSCPQARRGRTVSLASPAFTHEAKQRLYRESGACVVDMESGIAAAAAVRFGLRFASLRAVADPASRSLPSWVLDCVAPNGRIAGRRALALFARPSQWIALYGLAGDARAGTGSLAGAAAALQPHFGLLELS
ncbi:MAG: hypothetical protein JWL62_2144 [Hyphomicrobiales bacterium]|nr:hypothetical protein [Hyphomicrobiales bacterium]